MAKNLTPGQPYVYTGVYGLATNPVDINDKEDAVKLYVTQALCRTQSMFKYKGLPDTIPQRSLELYIQTGGSACIAKVNDELYAFFGTFGGEPDVYYMPRSYIVANPALNFSKEFRIHEDCVVIPNDAMYMGLMPIFRRYSTLLAENDVTLNMTDINIRIVSLLTGNTDRDIASAQQYIEDVKAGKIGIAMSTPFMEGLKTQPYGEISGKILTQLIELQQYYKASMFNDIGLNSNYNMKRETIVSAEIELNADALFPFVDNMLYCRQHALKEVNEMFGTDISVELASSWEDLSNSREVQDILEEAEALAALDGGDTTIMEQGIDSSQLDYENTEVSEEQGADPDVVSSQLDNEESTNGESNQNDSNPEDNSSEEIPQQEEQNPISDATEEIQEALIERLADVVDEHDEEHIEIEEDVKEIVEEAQAESEESSQLEEEESNDAGTEEDEEEDTERSDS